MIPSINPRTDALAEAVESAGSIKDDVVCWLEERTLSLREPMWRPASSVQQMQVTLGSISTPSRNAGYTPAEAVWSEPG
jgi:hypothetical protein